jgi:hypothetical protein
MEEMIQNNNIYQNDSFDELHKDIYEWLDEISFNGAYFQSTNDCEMRVFDSLDEYLTKFRNEFQLRENSTIKEVEDAFIEELESHLVHAIDYLKDTIAQAEDIQRAGWKELRCYIEICNCLSLDNLLDVAQSDADEAGFNLDNAEKVLAELIALNKTDNVGAA